MMLFGMFMAILAGAAIGIQAIFNNTLQRYLGAFGLTFWVHWVGLLVSLPLLLIFEPKFWQNLGQMRQAGVPLYIWLAGAFGVLVVPSVTFAMTKVSPAITFALLLVGQLVVALLLQQFGWLGVQQQPVSVGKLVALGIIIGGVALYFSQ